MFMGTAGGGGGGPLLDPVVDAVFMLIDSHTFHGEERQDHDNRADYLMMALQPVRGLQPAIGAGDCTTYDLEANKGFDSLGISAQKGRAVDIAREMCKHEPTLQTLCSYIEFGCALGTHPANVRSQAYLTNIGAGAVVVLHQICLGTKSAASKASAPCLQAVKTLKRQEGFHGLRNRLLLITTLSQATPSLKTMCRESVEILDSGAGAEAPAAATAKPLAEHSVCLSCKFVKPNREFSSSQLKKKKAGERKCQACASAAPEAAGSAAAVAPEADGEEEERLSPFLRRLVCLRGLVSRPGLNGSVGVAVHYSTESGRVTVRPLDAPQIRVRPENLTCDLPDGLNAIQVPGDFALPSAAVQHAVHNKLSNAIIVLQPGVYRDAVQLPCSMAVVGVGKAREDVVIEYAEPADRVFNSQYRNGHGPEHAVHCVCPLRGRRYSANIRLVNLTIAHRRPRHCHSCVLKCEACDVFIHNVRIESLDTAIFGGTPVTAGSHKQLAGQYTKQADLVNGKAWYKHADEAKGLACWCDKDAPQRGELVSKGVWRVGEVEAKGESWSTAKCTTKDTDDIKQCKPEDWLAADDNGSWTEQSMLVSAASDSSDGIQLVWVFMDTPEWKYYKATTEQVIKPCAGVQIECNGSLSADKCLITGCSDGMLLGDYNSKAVLSNSEISQCTQRGVIVYNNNVCRLKSSSINCNLTGAILALGEESILDEDGCTWSGKDDIAQLLADGTQGKLSYVQPELVVEDCKIFGNVHACVTAHFCKIRIEGNTFQGNSGTPLVAGPLEAAYNVEKTVCLGQISGNSLDKDIQVDPANVGRQGLIVEGNTVGGDNAANVTASIRDSFEPWVFAAYEQMVAGTMPHC